MMALPQATKAELSALLWLFQKLKGQ